MDTHWLFNYEHGFIKRGLVGEVLRLSGAEVTLQSLTAYQYAIILAASAAFLAVILWFVLKNCIAGQRWHNATIFAVALLLMTASGTLHQLIYEFGRFDAFGLIALCAVFACTRLLPGGLSLVVTLFLTVISILIHEALFLWVAPIAFWLWYFHAPSGQRRVWPIFVFGGVALCTVLIAGTSSYGDHFTFEEMRAQLAARSDIPIVDQSLIVQFRSLDENIEDSAQYLLTHRRLIGSLIALVAALPYVAVIVLSVEKARRVHMIWAFLAAFTPLALYVVGHDHGRWWAMVNVSLCFAMMCFLWNAEVTRQKALVLLPIIGLSTVAQLYLGPLGDILPYPYLGTEF